MVAKGPAVQPIYKECPVCHNQFLVSPGKSHTRYYLPNSTKFCSQSCARKGRYRSGQRCNKLSDTEAAYIAAFLDGEGHISLYKRNGKVSMVIVLTNTYLPVLEWMKTIIGQGSIATIKRQNKRYKTSYNLRLNSETASTLLDQLLPYLIIKLEQANAALDFQNRLKVPFLNADRTWQHQYYLKMKKLNQKGINGN